MNIPTSFFFLIILTLRSELHRASALKHPFLGTIHKQLSLEPYPRKDTGLKAEACVVGLSCHSSYPRALILSAQRKGVEQKLIMLDKSGQGQTNEVLSFKWVKPKTLSWLLSISETAL